MITTENVLESFGTKSNACQVIGISRPTLDFWIKQGEVTKQHVKGCKGKSAARDWETIIRKKGFNPLTLKKL